MTPNNSYLTFPFSEWIRNVSCVMAVMIGMYLAAPLVAQQSTAPVFSSPSAAVDALVQAVQKNDEATIEKVLGGPTDVASCQDDSQDKLDREMFLKKYQEMHRLHREPDGSVTLFIGAENWPFPIPLVQQGGAWHFDADGGGKEILFRRIGQNELEAIETCRGLVADQNQSGSGAGGTSASPFVGASSEAGDKSAPVVMHGYYFRILAPTSRKGDLLVVAYPAEYRHSGVMTFVMTGNQVIYEKDLGVNTAAVAGTLTGWRKDGTWRRVSD